MTLFSLLLQIKFFRSCTAITTLRACRVDTTGASTSRQINRFAVALQTDDTLAEVYLDAPHVRNVSPWDSSVGLPPQPTVSFITGYFEVQFKLPVSVLFGVCKHSQQSISLIWCHLVLQYLSCHSLLSPVSQTLLERMVLIWCHAAH